MIDRIQELDRFHRQYPHLFVRKIGLECGAGWFPLLDALFIVLERCIVEGIQTGQWQDRIGEGHTHRWPYALQIKEKFGGLRVHVSQWDVPMRAAIDLAKVRADGTCDQCADPGSLRRLGGYMCTRCDLHAQARGW